MQFHVTKKQAIYVLAALVVFLVVLLILWVATGSSTVVGTAGTGAAIAAAEATRRRMQVSNEIQQTVQAAEVETKKVEDTQERVDVQGAQIRQQVKKDSDAELQAEANRLFKRGK